MGNFLVNHSLAFPFDLNLKEDMLKPTLTSFWNWFLLLTLPGCQFIFVLFLSFFPLFKPYWFCYTCCPFIIATSPSSSGCSPRFTMWATPPPVLFHHFSHRNIILILPRLICPMGSSGGWFPAQTYILNSQDLLNEAQII